MQDFTAYVIILPRSHWDPFSGEAQETASLSEKAQGLQYIQYARLLGRVLHVTAVPLHHHTPSGGACGSSQVRGEREGKLALPRVVTL